MFAPGALTFDLSVTIIQYLSLMFFIIMSPSWTWFIVLIHRM